MKSLETQLVEQEAEIKRLREILQGTSKASSAKRSANAVDIVECYEGLGLSHQEALKAARVESSVIELNKAQRAVMENMRKMGLSEAEATLFALGRNGLRL